MLYLKCSLLEENSGEFLFVFGMKDLKYIKYRTIKEKVDKYFSA